MHSYLESSFLKIKLSKNFRGKFRVFNAVETCILHGHDFVMFSFNKPKTKLQINCAINSEDTTRAYSVDACVTG